MWWHWALKYKCNTFINRLNLIITFRHTCHIILLLLNLRLINMILFIHSRFRDTLHEYEIICTRKHSFYKTRMKRNVLLTKLYPSFWVLMSHYCSFARYSLIIYICSLRSYIFTIFFAQLDISWIKKPTAHDFTFNSLLNTKNFGIEIFHLIYVAPQAHELI